MSELEQRLKDAFTELKITSEQREDIKGFLKLLEIKDEGTYHHSIRVALKAKRIAEFMHLNPRPVFFAGCLHDIGKSLITPEVLKKTDTFTPDDMLEMKKHCLHSYQLIRGVFEFSAEIILRHHRWQPNGYPSKLPKSRIKLSRNARLIVEIYARILSLCDFYDAIKTRNNDKFENEKLTPEKIRTIMLESNSEFETLIEDLYTARIFS